MKIQPNGNSTQSDYKWLEKLAQIVSEQPIFKQGDFADTQSKTHTIQIKRLGLMKPLPDGVQPEWWVSTDVARKLI